MKNSMKSMGNTPSNDPWQAEDDARTLVKAETIKGDKGRHTAALGHAKTQHQALEKVVGGATKTSATAVRQPSTAKPATKSRGK